MDINWPRTISMTTYHVVISITVPILLVTLIFPDKRGEPWVKDRTMAILAALLALASGLIGVFILISPLRELTGARGTLLAGITAVLFLYWLYRRVRAREKSRTSP